MGGSNYLYTELVSKVGRQKEAFEWDELKRKDEGNVKWIKKDLKEKNGVKEELIKKNLKEKNGVKNEWIKKDLKEKKEGLTIINHWLIITSKKNVFEIFECLMKIYQKLSIIRKKRVG